MTPNENYRSDTSLPALSAYPENGIPCSQAGSWIAGGTSCCNAFYMLSPTDGEITSLTPVFLGFAVPGSQLTATLDDSPAQPIDIQPDGTWHYQSEEALEPGRHTIRIYATLPDACMECTACPCYSLAISFTAYVDPLMPVILFPQNGEVVDTPNPVVTGTGIPGSRITVTAQDMTYTTIVQGGGSWMLVLTRPLSAGYQAITAVQTDTYGNRSAPATVYALINTLSTPGLDLSREGAFGVSRSFLSGSAQPYATIVAAIDPIDETDSPISEKSALYLATADAFGKWRISPTPPVQGKALISIYQEDAQGRTSPALTQALEASTPPSKPTFIAPENGGVLTDTTPEVMGYGTPGYTVMITVRDTVYRTLVGENGYWSIPLEKPLPMGFTAIAATQVDGNGIPGPDASVAFEVREPIPPPVILSPTNGEIVHRNPLLITGTGLPLTFALITVNHKTYSVFVDEYGEWLLSLQERLPNGPLLIEAVQLDSDGSMSPEKAQVEATLISIQNAHLLSTIDGSSFYKTTPPLIGTGNPGFTVHVTVDDIAYTSIVNPFGDFAFDTITPLSDGTHIVSSWQVDPDGTVGPVQTNTITIDSSLAP